MKMRFVSYVVAALAVSLSAGSSQSMNSVRFDGILDGNDDYSTTEIVGFFNGHGHESIYGDFQNQLYKTYLRYTVAEVEGGTPGEKFFFLFAEVPIEAKNMIWGAGLSASDIDPYRVHYGTHHDPSKLNLDFGAATGSEKLGIVNSKGDTVLEMDLAGGIKEGGYGLLDFKDSVDYLLANAMATTSSSLNRDVTMSFELKFALDPVENQKVIEFARNGFDYHLSPERGLIPTQVPEPSSSLLLGLLSSIFLLRRQR